MNNERINHFAIDIMIGDVIESINEKKSRINQFKNEPLFINIYYCFYFCKFLSKHFLWYEEIIETLKENIRMKWLNCLPNIDFFIKQIEIKNENIDPFEYWFYSEDYFEKISKLKELADLLFPAKKEKKNIVKIYKKYKPIR